MASSCWSRQHRMRLFSVGLQVAKKKGAYEEINVEDTLKHKRKMGTDVHPSVPWHMRTAEHRAFGFRTAHTLGQDPGRLKADRKLEALPYWVLTSSNKESQPITSKVHEMPLKHQVTMSSWSTWPWMCTAKGILGNFVWHPLSYLASQKAVWTFIPALPKLSSTPGDVA